MINTDEFLCDCSNCKNNTDTLSNASLDSLLENIDINSNKRKIPSIDYENSDFICSWCGNGIVYIDDYNMYEYDNLDLLETSQVKKRIVKSPYAYEKEPKQWVIFCRRMCEIRYNNNLA